eukprot:GHVH01008247.1.p1 GENE.GHVH01008247.1~~GHVH01008247.1.p1  ORF type:complete len:370 (+),score=35.54 GHVH01008247.1:48-1157(+)
MFLSCSMSCLVLLASQCDGLDISSTYSDPLTMFADPETFKVLLDPLSRFKGDEFTHPELFVQLKHDAEESFDRQGFDSLIDNLHFLLSDSHLMRFHIIHSAAHPGSVLPHCDKGGGSDQADEDESQFPGGSYGRHWGFNMVQWLTDLLMKPINEGGESREDEAMSGVMSKMALMQAVGLVEEVAGIIAEVVPPKIPPPPWLLRPLPCMPMVTGLNCLGSVLYPIPMPDFIMASVKDKSMIMALDSFPQKYYEKVGRTSNARYEACARAYLGLMCANTFHMCYLVPGQSASTAFPPCLPQCILVLLACPGFWMEDIMPACGHISFPPFCSFSVFVQSVPPQVTTAPLVIFNEYASWAVSRIQTFCLEIAH